ncbi:MAG: hypothetical protein K2X77_16125 [Candidatus Obscuribacterales bacterium]|jgi:predicted nucleotidyltransferase|nr:hypothetical protein [Candidatus Obscuribacterales bacterium]
MVVNLVELLVSKLLAIEEICTKYGASKIKVSGPCLRSNRRKDCPIDFLLNVPPALVGFDYFDSLNGLKQELEDLLEVEVNIQDADALIGKSRKRILAEAISLSDLAQSHNP